ncbi:hypothetical protein PoMZ_09844, partial [Pyricularia oryzae]
AFFSAAFLSVRCSTECFLLLNRNLSIILDISYRHGGIPLSGLSGTGTVVRWASASRVVRQLICLGLDACSQRCLMVSELAIIVYSSCSLVRKTGGSRTASQAGTGQLGFACSLV